ncbi:MAG: RHS repeat-associated core domain-containing protein, partial [Candidatus Eremiobacteraeota bacterium]|nr:RHS repeat-associated core domain-containing protein [Candidatus Eremiobacteraeota bacterium]
TELAYDGMSRRTKITELADGTVTSKKLYWWLGGSIVCERDGLQPGFPITRRFFGQGEVRGSTKLYYAMDHLGSVRELVDSAGAVRAEYSYSTYGERNKEAGDLESEWGYAGLWHHQASGLDLATYRAYDAANKRWISRDPLGEGVDYNLYRYCGNSPVNHTDPSGLDPWYKDPEFRKKKPGPDFMSKYRLPKCPTPQPPEPDLLDYTIIGGTFLAGAAVWGPEILLHYAGTLSGAGGADLTAGATAAVVEATRDVPTFTR